MKNNISASAASILEGLNEALMDAQGQQVNGIRKTVVFTMQPKEIRERLNMSQQEFSSAFGIPLATLRNWEQGRRQLDATANSYLKVISMFPNEVMAAQEN